MDTKGVSFYFFRFSLLAVAVTLPWNIYLNSLSIILLSFSWLMEGNITGKLQRVKTNPLIILFIVFYALFILGMFYTENLAAGKFNLEKKLSLFVLPVVLGTTRHLDRSLLHAALKFFVASCMAASFLCLVNGLYHYIVFNDHSYFFYENLSSVLHSHPIYFAAYLCFSMLILLHFTMRNFNLVKRHQRIFLILALVYLFMFIVLLSARMVLLFLFLYMISFTAFSLAKKRKMKSVYFIIALICVTFILLISGSDFLRERFTKLVETDLSVTQGGKENGLTIRLVKWKCSTEGIFENPVLGTGTGDAVDYLVSCYERKNFWGMYPQYRFNSHNQYLETALTLGLLGLSVFILCLFLPFMEAIKNNEHLFLSFLALFSFCCITESFLERQQGIVFFTFFVSLFSFRNN